jgi:hypothetical protein
MRPSPAHRSCKPGPCVRCALAPAGVALLVLGGSVAAESLPDPTRPAGSGAVSVQATAAPPTEWRLSLTRIAGGEGLARLNGRLVRPGDRLEGATVLAVAPGSVVLLDQGRRFTVSLARGLPPGARIEPEKTP